MNQRLIALLLVCAGTRAYAESISASDTISAFDLNHYRSPQHFALEIKFGPYSPSIDNSAGLKGAQPFANLFQAQNKANIQKNGREEEPGVKLLTQVEFDYQFFHKFGSIGIGGTFGYYNRSSHSFISTAPNGTTSCVITSDPNLTAKLAANPALVPCTRSGDTTALTVFPISGLVVYRFDVLALKYHIPLVPYVKAGLGYYIWWIQDGNGNTAKAIYYDAKDTAKLHPHTLDGYGGSFGLVFNPGIALMLDFLEPTAARTLDNELGINHSYLFCELHYAWVNGFGAANKMDLSDTTLNAGLAFEF